jgi:tRNA nucleotidyltransferase (CCA-adding enzyme)
MEAEGWMQALFPAWTTAAADAPALEEMRKLVTQLQMQGVSPDISAASVQYLTAKLGPRDLAALKALFVRPGFVEEWNNLDNAAREFNKQLSGKDAATPSATWKLFTTADPQAVLWLGLTSKTPAIQAKYKNFFTVWPEAKQKVPHALFQELRITPEVPGYEEMLSLLFLGIIDGKLETDEQLREFLQPYSPPAPPPPVTVRRTRGSKKIGEAKKIAVEEAAFDGDALELDDEDAAEDLVEDADAESDEDDGEPPISHPPAAKKGAAPRKSVPENGAEKPAAHPPVPAKAAPVAVKAPVVSKPAPNPSLHVVAPGKTAKVHVMVKPEKPAKGASIHPPKPAAGHHAPSHGHAPAKKATPIKAAKAAPAKAAGSKAAPAKPAKHPAVKTAPPAKTAAKAHNHGKKAVAKAPVKPVHKKSEPAKKSAPLKKAAPVKKHR